MQTQMLQERVKTSQNRYDYLDNLRFFLIFCVVFGHLLELAPFPERWEYYLNIYSFHMPALIFLFGCFAKWDPGRILFRWVLPYGVFQTLYFFFNKNVLLQNVTLQYTTPNWILWFMLACIVYLLLMPLYNTKSKWCQGIFLAVAVYLALVVGFDKTVGYYMTLSRITVFMPWFLLGVYFRKNNGFRLLSQPGLWHWVAWGISLVLVLLSIRFVKEQGMNAALLYGSYSYSVTGVTLELRAASMVIALIWLVFLCLTACLLLRRRLWLVTSIGRNTLPIFLLHGFAVKLIGAFCPEQTSTLTRVLLLSVCILPVLGNKWVKKLVDFISLTWLERFVPYDR